MQLQKQHIIRFFKVNPQFSLPFQDQANALMVLTQILNREELYYDDTPVTYDSLLYKYKEYVSQWKQQFSGTEERFIKAENKLKCVYDWLETKAYRSDVMTDNPEMNQQFKLLFNGMSLEQANTSFNNFLNKIKSNSYYAKKGT